MVKLLSMLMIFLGKGLALSSKFLFCVAGILKREDHFLIAERPKGKEFAGFWEFPGGKVNHLESPESALQRELNEELGIMIALHGLSFLTHFEYDYPTFRLSMNTYVCTTWQGEPQPCENQEIKWVPLQALANFKMLPANTFIVNALKELSQV